MFGVTTPCVNEVAAQLGEEFDCLVFHATGTGGQSMEKLADSGLLSGIVDVTTTEVCDLLIGGVFPCTEDRLGAVARTRLPYVGSCGALDMVNFGARQTVPSQFAGRRLYEHNPQVTLMRTTAEENTRIGRWIGEKLNRCEGPVRFLLPEKGVSTARHARASRSTTRGQTRPSLPRLRRPSAPRCASRWCVYPCHQRPRIRPRPRRPIPRSSSRGLTWRALSDKF